MPVGRAMPSTKTKTKDDVSQRIQEIKQRQQNWLKQRDKSKEQSELSGDAVAQSKPSKNNAILVPHDVQNSKSLASNATKEQVTDNVREKFKHWIETRSHSHERNNPNYTDSNSVLSGSESELERLISPEQSPATQPVSEEEFGSLADKIAYKVKEDLGLQQSNCSFSGTPKSKSEVTENGMPVWNTNRCKTFIKELPTFNHVLSPSLSSHNCTVCKKLMLSPKNIPTMVIPCGHTFCKSCLEEMQNCPSCDCSAVSLTVNIMLLQVIKEYHSNKGSSRSTSSATSDTIHFSDKDRQFQEIYIKDNLEKVTTFYKTQLENLETRCNILSTEHKNLVHKQKQVVTRLLQDQKQTQNIRRQEEEVEKAVSDLQEKLQVLKKHRESYESQINILEDEKLKLDEKIALLSVTIDSLTKETEKVKLLSESELRTKVAM